MDHRSYRRDIDGLRAVAVIPVVLFHAGATLFLGGFAGVDVFFVISGFLITGTLFTELEASGRISILRFYGRRVARIFPALLLVVAITLLAGLLLLSPALYEIHSLAKSVIASVGFVANLYFLFVTDTYFAPDTATLPLLHMWSLAVEEQYYLVWPLLMITAMRLPDRFASLRSRCLAAVLAITVASLLSCIAINASHPAAAFYLPFTRAWELGLGSALALLRPCNVARVWRGLAGFVGIALVLVGYVVIRESGSFPFPLALLPTIGTCLLIWGGGGRFPHAGGASAGDGTARIDRSCLLCVVSMALAVTRLCQYPFHRHTLPGAACRMCAGIAPAVLPHRQMGGKTGPIRPLPPGGPGKNRYRRAGRRVRADSFVGRRIWGRAFRTVE